MSDALRGSRWSIAHLVADEDLASRDPLTIQVLHVLRRFTLRHCHEAGL
ncbi:hypothetical protein [Ornithinimicrobium sp. LYQ103]